MDDEELRFQRGDLESVMAAHPHVAQWVKILRPGMVADRITMVHWTEMLDKMEPMNLIYVTKEPIFVHMYRPD